MGKEEFSQVRSKSEGNMKTHQEAVEFHCVTDPQNVCRGMHCMGWRWDVLVEDTMKSKGHCGAAGKI